MESRSSLAVEIKEQNLYFNEENNYSFECNIIVPMIYHVLREQDLYEKLVIRS